ncbi:MAG: aldolase/citrate lyase family protein [Pseudomonadota bacterium]
MISRFREQLEENKAVTMVWCGMRDPQLVSTIARQDFQAVLLDSQHGYHNEASFLESIPLIVLAGKTPLVRIPVNRWDLCERVLDFGALGVVAPMINTLEEAKVFAAAVKYPKIGSRSYGPHHAAMLYGLTSKEYVIEANDATIALAQIETLEAYKNLDAILSVDGIDGVLMGPSDFSISVTGQQVPDPYGSDTVKIIADIAERTNALGKVAAAFTVTAEHANLVHSMGYRLISIGSDSQIVTSGAEKCFENLAF